MLTFEWNALRIGDRVTVHDDDEPALTLHAGTVTTVETQRGSVNIVGIRLDDSTGPIQLPRRHAVHLLPLTGGRTCWRCEATP
jgi:hypothetical protein